MMKKNVKDNSLALVSHVKDNSHVRGSCGGPYGPSPGWGPVRVGAHMGPYGPLWVLLDRSGHVRFPTFGSISHVSDPKIVF